VLDSHTSNSVGSLLCTRQGVRPPRGSRHFLLHAIWIISILGSSAPTCPMRQWVWNDIYLLLVFPLLLGSKLHPRTCPSAAAPPLTQDFPWPVHQGHATTLRQHEHFIPHVLVVLACHMHRLSWFESAEPLENNCLQEAFACAILAAVHIFGVHSLANLEPDQHYGKFWCNAWVRTSGREV